MAPAAIFVTSCQNDCRTHLSYHNFCRLKRLFFNGEAREEKQRCYEATVVLHARNGSQHFEKEMSREFYFG